MKHLKLRSEYKFHSKWNYCQNLYYIKSAWNYDECLVPFQTFTVSVFIFHNIRPGLFICNYPASLTNSSCRTLGFSKNLAEFCRILVESCGILVEFCLNLIELLQIWLSFEKFRWVLTIFLAEFWAKRRINNPALATDTVTYSKSEHDSCKYAHCKAGTHTLLWEKGGESGCVLCSVNICKSRVHVC